MNTQKFSKKTKYVAIDGWRGYLEPVYAIVGWNDTGSYDDSPCPTETGMEESKLARRFLRKNKIPVKMMTCETSNVFCVHRYLITTVDKVDEARQLLKEWYPTIKSETRLLYIV